MTPKRTFLHEDWTGDAADGNDIALMMLSTPSKHTPIALPATNLTLWNGLPVAAIGWGTNEDMTQQDSLHLATRVIIVGNRNCNGPEAWNGTIVDTMVCAYGFGYGLGEGQDTCLGKLVLTFITT